MGRDDKSESYHKQGARSTLKTKLIPADDD
jgi:hypothetical protein